MWLYTESANNLDLLVIKLNIIILQKLKTAVVIGEKELYEEPTVSHE